MRFFAIGLAAALLALPLSPPASACEGLAASAEAASADLSAMAKKPTQQMVKKKKEKVEYMRAAPMPPAAKK
jgi:hypothetical protein